MAGNKRIRARNLFIILLFAALIALAMFLPELLIGISERSASSRIREKDASEYLLERTEEDLFRKLEILSRDNTMKMILSIPEGEKRTKAEEAALRELNVLLEAGAFDWVTHKYEFIPSLYPEMQSLVMTFDSVLLMSAFSVSDGSSFSYYVLKSEGAGIEILLDAAEEKILSASFKGDGAEECVLFIEDRFRFMEENGTIDTRNALMDAAVRKSWGTYFDCDLENYSLDVWTEDEAERLEMALRYGPGWRAWPGESVHRQRVAVFELVRGEDRVVFPVVYEKKEGEFGSLLYGPAYAG